MKYLHETFTESKKCKKGKKPPKYVLNKGNRNLEIWHPWLDYIHLESSHPYSVVAKSHSIIAISLKNTFFVHKRKSFHFLQKHISQIFWGDFVHLVKHLNLLICKHELFAYALVD